MLFLRGNDAGLLRQRATQDPHAAQLAEAVLAGARDILAQPLIERRFEAGRPVMLPTSRRMADRVFFLGLAFFLTGGQIYRRRLIDEMLAVSAFPDWNRTHFLDAAEMLAAVAIGRDWCAPLLTAREKSIIDTAIVEFALTPGLHALIGGSAWTKIPTNWNIVCSAGLIIGALALDNQNSEIGRAVLEKACHAIRVGLAAYGADGGWPEGAGYWEYATRFAVLALAALESKGCMLLTVDEFPALLKTWRFGRALTAPSGMVFDSGDSLATGRRLPVYGWLAQKGDDAEAASWQWSAPGDRHPLDLLWYKEPANIAGDTRPEIEIFHDAGYATLCGRASGSNVYLAIRGGSNRTNHAHLDLGTFILERDGVRFVSDLGREDYAAPGYFKAETRFTHFRTRSRAHNTINLNGSDQSLDARADFSETPQASTARRIACRIHDPDAPFHHCRGFMVLKNNSVIIVDRLVPVDEAATADIEWNLFTRAVVTVRDRGQDLAIGADVMHLSIHHPEPAILSRGPVSELASGSDVDAFTRISLKLQATGDTMIAAVFSRQSGDDNSEEINTLCRWLEEVTDAVLL